MDDIVKQAMAKWPNVPHCYGWLALDARGNWRMRDERAQQMNEPGDKLTNAALVGFINRNYQRDERGCWFFQNGPQRVFLNLESTPFVVRTDPAQGLVLHTGASMPPVEAAYLTEAGELILQAGDIVAQLDDRDFAQALAWFDVDGEALLKWIERPEAELTMRLAGNQINVEHIGRDDAPVRLGFVRVPTGVTVDAPTAGA
ncbi:DUF2946 family protein [Pseudoduganella plicata]|uniref:DUF2946 family protein n=1 Tax=Pseudoduganella plicata TaxID=321984 RepID=A0A4P7BEK3_9BURK|nr:DUF2946 family protein [Pseudoduganella plicata]QBQ37054.1 DUF2946 family protein [Pseudoduganella plicata]GGY99744.1 hypothetical protein GCM10007388_36780 [Pseudoduganella plicata]